MTNLLIRLFVKQTDSPMTEEARQAFGILAGCVGIVANLLLCIGKFLLGIWTGSISLQADAVNNLSDAGSSVVAIVGAKAAGKPADREHPFGHARAEYIAALVVAFLICFVGIELAREGIDKIINPAPVSFGTATIILLIASVGIKLWLGLFNRKLGNLSGSKVMKATMLDSLCDVVVTSIILVSVLLNTFLHVQLDGYLGVLVALFVLYTGIKIVKETISPLMGEAPGREMVQELTERLLSYEGINGIHDLMIHNYGPRRTIATVHAEVDYDMDMLECHALMDKAEREIGERMHLQLTIHMDPCIVGDEEYDAVKAQIERTVERVDGRLSFHDFRMIKGKQQTNLMFDIVVPHGVKHDQIGVWKQEIREGMRTCDEKFVCIITVDSDYTGSGA